MQPLQSILISRFTFISFPLPTLLQNANVGRDSFSQNAYLSIKFICHRCSHPLSQPGSTFPNSIKGKKKLNTKDQHSDLIWPSSGLLQGFKKRGKRDKINYPCSRFCLIPIKSARLRPSSTSNRKGKTLSNFKVTWKNIACRTRLALRSK